MFPHPARAGPAVRGTGLVWIGAETVQSETTEGVYFAARSLAGLASSSVLVSPSSWFFRPG
jgi:hypothetical protein